jgi:uncharacterized repeat protein (TIGR01451 family)
MLVDLIPIVLLFMTYLRKELLYRFAVVSLAVTSALVFGLPARAVNLVQEFYLPMPEQQIYQANTAIIAGTGSTIFSTFSVVVTGDGTVINYDQWEDGYEINLAAPTQGTTQIWGDGNDANGVPPGFAHDPAGMTAGTVITLTNNVTLPRNPSTILWDARDRLAANKALVISRAAWPIPTGPVFAGAAGVLSTMDYGTNYISPVGQNLTNGLMKYVGMFIMAAQNNTAITIDPNGNGVGTTNIVLNQGESYLVNGGILKGGRVTATKPIQADLLIGHVGASYASDWFTLYPVSAWDNTYYTPVGTAASGNPAFVYLYNPATNAITINYTTRVGAGSFSVPGSNGVFQFQMPVGSGASFTSAGGQNFFAICTVGASPSADTAYNWGFTLVPKTALTTEATVGWGPGSADGTVNGSPVWVTTLGNTRLYVDYKGNHAGPLTDPNGNKYDTNFNVSALQAQKIFDPSKNQTGMRVYTVDGTLLTAAWGEDPDVASPGNPYIDAGTTVLPFPVPTLTKTVTIVTDTVPTGLSIGDTVQYTVTVNNKGLLPLGNTLVIDAPSTNLTYLTNTTTYNGSPIPDSATGTPFPLDTPGYTIPIILSQGSSTFTYLYQINASGVVSNGINIGGTTITATTTLAPPPTNGATVSLNFTDTNGVSVASYLIGANVFVTMTNAVGNSASNSIQTISVSVTDTNTGDIETIPLVETGTNTGVFRNVVVLPTSGSSGLLAQDGVLHVIAGDILSVSYTDPVYFDSATNTAAIQVPVPNKQLYLSVNGSTNGTQALNRVNPAATPGHGTTYSSIDIGSGSGGGGGPALAIGIDGSFSAAGTNVTGFTNVYTTGSGTNGLMLVSVGTDNKTISSITYNGIAMTSVASIASTANVKPRVEIFSLTNPAAGAHNLVVQFSASARGFIGVSTFTNVNQATPLGTPATAADTQTATVTSATNQLVFGAICADHAVTNSAGQSQQWNVPQGTVYGVGSTVTGASSTSLIWTGNGSNPNTRSGVAVVPILPSNTGGVAGPATNRTAFTQTPSFVLPFTMPSGGQVTITNFITITNGTLTSGSAVTATLQTNGVNFLTLTNPVYTVAAGVTNLVWTGTLNSTVAIPSGAVITCVISNNVANTAFHVNYDSTNQPSKITLPASTVIAINTLGVYDAPFPNGNLVSAPVAGSTLYIRANVTDPFGSYDIASLGLVVTGPSAGSSFTNTLTDTSVVTNDASSKTYEYQWVTGPTTGGYNLAATANEGTEGVTAAAAAGISLIFLDLGTPSTTEFTSGANGAATNSYLANTTLFVRVTDLNRNTNATTIDSVVVTVTSSSGDAEPLTLIETGVNTGIFTNAIAGSTNAVNAATNGILYAPVGSILTASYTDPTDTSDSTSATATIQPLPGVPGLVINKTIVSPSGGQVGVGQSVIYNLQIVNVGSTTLPSLKVMDAFTSAGLSYSSASLAPDATGAGLLTWNNLGSFTPGQSTNITVTFTTLATGTATNSATANGSTATNTSAVTILINSAAVNVTKVLLSPTNQPVSINSNVVFRITIQNVGNTTITSLPMEDTFSGAYYQYVSATIPTNGSGFGTLIWTNLAAPTPLATNAIITNDVTMKVIGQGNPANNTATVDFAFDSFGNAVPAVSSTVGVTTSSAGINGHVYNDINQSGVYTTGDTGLSDVTLQLFTDPNGDGNPADGTLVQVTTTDANGYYELLNLPMGTYVVVETDLPGYSSSAPVNNRLPFNLATLTVNTNGSFFDYIPAPSVYSTFSGTVYNDVLGTGVNTNQSGLNNIAIDLVQDVNSNGVADVGEPIVGNATTDTNGNYSIANITPGRYVLRENDAFGYYSSGDSQAPNDNQIAFVTTNGIVSTNNSFFDRLSPVANNDTNSALLQVPATLNPLTNDVSPNGDALIITNVSATGGTVVINPGSTNLTFTPTNLGTATIIYTIADAHGGTNSATITVTVTDLADLAIGKTAAASVLASNNVTYTISVTNFGPTPASSVTVTDALPANVTFVSASGGGVNNSGVVTWNLGTLTNGFTGSVTVTVAAPASGSLTNLASIGSPTSDPIPTNNVTPPVVTTVTPQADLAIVKTAPANIPAATGFTYTISVTNFGPSDASSVVVTDTLPASVTFISASGSGTTNAGVVTWNLGTLTNGQSSNLTVTVTSPASGSLTNIAGVSSPTGDPISMNNVTPPVITSVSPVADLGLGKAGPASVVYGSNFTYTVSVTNFGPSTAAGILVTDSLPAGLSFVSAIPSATTNAGNQVIWTNLGSLASGATTNLTLTVAPNATGSVSNTASVGSPVADPTPTNNTTPPVVTTVTPGQPVVTWPNPASIVYGTPLGTNQNAATASVPGTFVYSPTNGAVLPVGTNTLSVVFTPADTNYATTNLTVPLIVTPALLTVTANDTNKLYGAANPAFTASIAGFVNGENSGVISGSPSLTTTATTNSGAGSYPITATNGTLSAANYVFSFVNGTLTVNQATLTVTANSTNKIYGAANPTFTASYSGFVNGENSGVLSGSPSLTTTATTNTGVGSYPIAATNGTLSAANYVFSFVDGTLSVNAATLTVTANNTNRLYNTANPTFTASYSGFVNGENSSVLSGAPSLTTTATLSSPAGSYPITATNGTLSAANYAFSFADGTLTIFGGNYGITWTNPASIVYGTLLDTNQNAAVATLPGGYVYNPTNGTLLPAGTNLLSVIFTPTDTNYPATNASVQLVVTPAPLTITANSTNKTYNTTLNLGTTAFTSSGLVNSETVGGVSLASAGAVASAPVGTYPITPGNAAGGTFNPANYSITYSNGTLTVTAAAYTATWPTPTNIVYGTALDTNQNDATATIPGTFSYNPTNGTVLPAGTNALTTQFTPTDTNYAATNLSVQLVVTPAPLTITANDTNKLYNTTLMLGSGQTAFTSSGLVNGDALASVTLASSGAVASAPVGTYPIIPSAAVGSGLTNYSIGYSNGTLTVLAGTYGIIWTNPASIVYGTPLGTNQNDASATVPGGYVYNPTNGTVLDVGTNLLGVVFTPADTNYSTTNLSVTILVTPASLSVTASNATRLYGQANPVFGGTITGIRNGDSISATYASVATTNSPAGTYPIVPSLVDPNSRLVNYTVTTNNGTLTVSKAVLVVTANNTNKVYGAANPVFTASYSGFVSGDTSSVLSGSPSLTTTATNGSSVGSYTIVATNGTLAATNYVFSFVNGTLTVGQAALTVTANSTNKIYGATNPAFTASYSGFVNGDTSSVLSGSPGLTTTATTNSGVGPYGITATNGTLSATNYSFTFASGTLTVNAATLTVTANNTNRLFGAANPTFTASYSGFVNGDTSSVLSGAPSLTTTATTNSPAGTYPIVTTNGTLSAANYVFGFANGTLTVVGVATADLAVFKTGPASGVAGSNLVYTITVTNIGPNGATNVLVKDFLPAGLSFISASPTNVTLLSNVVTWAAFNLAAHGKTNLTLTARSLEGGTFTNFAAATSDAVDPNPTNSDGTATNSQVVSVVTPRADVAVFKTGGTNAFAGGIANYTITVTNLGPSTASNVVVKDNLPAGTSLVSASGSYSVSNNVVSWASLTLSNGATASFTIALTVPLSGTFTNIALSTSTTSDPNATNNNGSVTGSRVATKIVPSADVVVILTGPPSAIQGSNFVYTLTVTNAGPSTSSNLVVSDSLPLGLTFVSASGGGKVTNSIITWPLIKSFAAGATTNYTITVSPQYPGSFTNIASALAATFDPNSTNNSGVLPASRALTQVGVAQFGILAGAAVLNPQTGLYEENVTVTNTAGVTILGFRLYVGGLSGGITLYNASGTSNGVPYVNYNAAVASSNTASLILQFFDPTRVPFTNTLSAEAILPAEVGNSTTNNSVAISSVFLDTRIEGDPRFVIEFASVPGKTYTVIYSSDLVTWKIATPSITAGGNITQWYDDGPPATESKPASVGARYYRVIKY